MKKILLIIPAFNHGGTNRALLNMLHTVDRTRYSIHILSMYFSGPYEEKLKQFDLLPEDFSLSAVFSFGNPFKTADFVKGLRRLFWKILYKTFFKGSEENLFRFAAQKYDKQRYDAVVAFQEGRATHFASKIQANTRVAWVHCDYSNYLKITGAGDEAEIYDKFQHIVCVSEYTASVFRKIYPALSERTYPIHNLIDANGITDASRDNVEITHDCFTLISVGRMDPVKRFTYIPQMAQSMKRSGCVFKWYIVGSGGDEYSKVRENINNCGVQNEVILLGAKDNPYPYIALSDVLVCPSYSEACPNVVNEAKILHVPVVAADFPSAGEYIKNGVNGVITSIDNIADVLIRMCSDKQFYTGLKNGISNFVYDNDEIMKKIEKVLDGKNA